MILFTSSVLAFLLVDAAWKARARRGRALALAVGGAVLVALALVSIPNLLYLGRVAGRLAMPAGLIWVGIGACAASLWVRREVRATAAALVAFVSFTLAGNGPLGAFLTATLESDYVARASFEGEPLDAIFVLGGGTSGSEHGGRARLTDSGDRLLTAARVYRGRRVGTVVTSGSTIPGVGRPRDVAEEGAQVLVDLDVPESAIVRLPEPRNSSQEVAAYAALAKERGWERMGVVTSAWHMRRVQRLLERAGVRAEPIPADFRGGVAWSGFLSLVPDGSGFRDVQRAAWEYLGAAVGR